MPDVLFQYSRNGLMPVSLEDAESLSNEFKNNQIVRGKIHGISAKKARSVPALNLLMACFAEVALNSPDPKFDTKEKAKFGCKVALDYRYMDRVGYRPDGVVVFEYRSFGFDSLGHMESCNVFNRAYSWMADILGCSVEELVEAAKEKMRRF